MYKEPNILMNAIPAASPYYDRLRALAIDRDFTPANSPDRQWIEQQITELTNRATLRMEADRAITLL